jgi:hypothetical protein
MRARTLKQVAAAVLISTASGIAFLLENRGTETVVVAERSEPETTPAMARSADDQPADLLNAVLDTPRH